MQRPDRYDFYNSEDSKSRLLRTFHTVETMMEECCRSRSWAYQMIASYPSEGRILCDLRTGKKELAIPRTYVSRYMARVKRGNPYW
jgi:hypothetical protein